jgi:hypothetical protein
MKMRDAAPGYSDSEFQALLSDDALWMRGREAPCCAEDADEAPCCGEDADEAPCCAEDDDDAPCCAEDTE